jgi:hypothetical protein
MCEPKDALSWPLAMSLMSVNDELTNNFAKWMEF